MADETKTIYLCGLNKHFSLKLCTKSPDFYKIYVKEVDGFMGRNVVKIRNKMRIVIRRKKCETKFILSN